MPEKKSNPIALIPILVFLVLYLGLGIVFEYVLKIPMGFYKIPMVVVFLIALLVACLQSRKMSFKDKLACMGKGIGEQNVVTMILIFLCVGVFVGTVGRNSALSVAYFMLSIFPPRLTVVVLFLVACFVSLSMGTSVGTITLLTPIAIFVAQSSNFGEAFCIGSVISGAMFGDNLSFISDTTIAACNGQGCQMNDKFKENFFIALPAAIVACILIGVVSFQYDINVTKNHEYDLIQAIPYIVVLLGGFTGVNIFYILLLGIVSGSIIMLCTKSVTFTELVVNMGNGATGMYETTMVAILVSAIGALVAENGGFEALLQWIKKVFRGKKGGQFGIGLLVILVDISTANNTVAIVMANPIAKEISETFDISKRRTASLLDTFSCVAQGIIPYGAQMLVALSVASQVGAKISAFDIIPYLFYSFLLLSSVILAIFIKDKKSEKIESNK